MINPHEKMPFNNFFNEPVSLAANLIFYHFNEPTYTGAAGDVVDSSGLSKNSTSTGSLTKAAGIFGMGIKCGGGSGVNLQVNTFDLAFSERTISIWFVANSTSGISMIYEEGGTVNGINIYIVDGLLYGHTYKNNGSDFKRWHTAPVNIETWYHVVITYSNTGGFLLYVNGVATGAALPLGFDMPSHSNPNALCYQNDDSRRHDVVDSNNTGGHPFNGILDELAVWNRTLSPDEILNLYLRQGRL